MTTSSALLTTNDLLLRPFRDSDLENVFYGLSNPDVIKHYGIHFDSIEATKVQMDWFANLEKTGTGIWWAICSPDDQIFYGAIGLNNLEKDNRKAEIGFWLFPQFWGKGIIKEVLPLICEYGFSKLGLHRIEAFVESGNQNCKRAIAKLNFKHEGTLTDCEIKNGNFISLEVYAMINPD